MANQHFQIVIIGAGPAGMAAALTTTKAGLETIVIDDQKDSGGQVYRNLRANQKTSPAYLGQSYYDGARLAQSFADCGAIYRPDCTVWQITNTHEIALVSRGKAELIT
ncbi:MAG: FAD-dependent oxidoreductase, partial [Candidatus Puniceispirillaceae bacterium]